MARHAAWICFALVAGCHLIGGVHDLDYSGVGAGAAGAGGGEGGATGGGGSGGGCGSPCVDADCMPVAAGTDCTPDGGAMATCDAEGVCADGVPVAARMFGGVAVEEANAFAVMPNGDVVIAGHTGADTTFSFGDGLDYETVQMPNAYVARLDSDFEGIWAKRLSPENNSPLDRNVTAMTAVGDNVVIGGDWDGILKIEPAQDEISGSMDVDAFVSMLDENGDEMWTWRGADGSGTQRITAVAANDKYVAALGFTTMSIVNFSGQMLDKAFVVVFDHDGVELVGSWWDCTQIVDDITLPQAAADLAFAPDGNLWIVGTYDQECMLFGQNVQWVALAGPFPFFVEVPISDAGSTTFGTPNLISFGASDAKGHGLQAATTPDGVVIAGDFKTEVVATMMDFGDGVTLVNQSVGMKPFVVTYNEAGPKWARQMEEVGDLSARPVTDVWADDVGNVLLSFTLDSTNLLSEPFAWTPNGDEALGLKYAADGSFLWGRGTGAPGNDRQIGMRPAPDGTIIGFGDGEANSLFGAPENNQGLRDLVIYRANP
jgi:hypothetical protein